MIVTSTLLRAIHLCRQLLLERVGRLAGIYLPAVRQLVGKPRKKNEVCCRWLVWRWLVVAVWATATHAATEVSGALSTDGVWTTAASPYLVTADVSVTGGALLHIEPGVVVYMNPGTSFVVSNGSLRATGQAGAPVVFTSVREQSGGVAPGDWEQLVFLDNTNDANTVLDGVEIRYGKGVRLQSASPTLNRLSLVNNAGAAVSMDLNSSPAGTGLQATGNAINGIVVPAGEIAGSVQWRLQGIPYVLTEGEISVGRRPVISGISPSSIQPGQTLDAVVSGTRLSGAEHVAFDSPGLSSTIGGTSSDSAIAVRIVASAAQALGNVGFEVQTAAGSVRFDAGVTVIPVKPIIALGSIAPSTLRRDESKSFVIDGSSLQGAQVTVPSGVGLSLSNLQTTPVQVTFTLAASASATVGAQALTVTNPAVANGSAIATITVKHAFPKIVANPSPLVVPPDGNTHAFSLQLTNSDELAHTLNLSVSDPSIASVSPVSVTVPAGESQVMLNMAGLKLGYTVLNVTSPTLAAIAVPVYVTNALNSGASIGPLVSVPVGVDRMVDGNTLPPGSVVSPLISRPVGVERGMDMSSLPAGTTLGPVTARPVGVDRATNTVTLPAGTTLGPVLSSPVGVARVLGP